ncbi:GAF domain-containing protein [Nocardia mexicana]|uniref:Uncharacterized protein n=1 Tax=Nocardia mexicana TaxID=279262 RepID=A0A370HBU9_9NOCA|nr:GAF domain-containing protein [Nocardia mexicana]RDI53971.1 hypothetical protein DFR68_10292 [Nocardia mexicana]
MYGERVLIETLGERETWTALAVDGRPAQWRSVLRVLSPETLRIVVAAFERAEAVEAEVPSRLPGDRRTMTVSATPVVGPDTRAHAVQVRTTPAGAALPAPYSVAAFGYSADTRAIQLGDQAAGWTVPADRANWTVPEAFRYVERFDGSMDLLLRTLDPSEHQRWAGDLTARVEGHPRRYRLALRSGADRQEWRGLLHDLTDHLVPEPISLDGATLSALGQQRSGRGHLVLADVRDVRLIRWVTDPVPGIQWKGTVDDRDTPHPDDVVRIFSTVGDMVRAGAMHARIGEVRLRRIGGGWTVVDARCTVLPAPGTPALMLIELTITGTSDDPDPTEPFAP